MNVQLDSFYQKLDQTPSHEKSRLAPVTCFSHSTNCWHAVTDHSPFFLASLSSFHCSIMLQYGVREECSLLQTLPLMMTLVGPDYRKGASIHSQDHTGKHKLKTTYRPLVLIQLPNQCISNLFASAVPVHTMENGASMRLWKQNKPALSSTLGLCPHAMQQLHIMAAIPFMKEPFI